MIAYYNPDSGDITAIAWNVIPQLTDPYIETDDPLLLKFLTSEEIPSLYKVVMVDMADSVKPQLISKQTSPSTEQYDFREKISIIPKNVGETDIVIEQYCDSIVVKFTQTALQQWTQSPKHKDRACVIIASSSETPYFPVWSSIINISDLDNLITTIGYDGPPNVRLFVSIPFGSISHKTLF